MILCCNSAPALNDVTYPEMLNLLQEVATICPIIKNAISTEKLIAMESGQTGPCLDLRYLKNPFIFFVLIIHRCISERLCCEMTRRQVDLIVIEGMGRSVHTNLNATFTCESFKIAVVKNRWLAKRLGGDVFSVICQYARPS